MEDVGSITCQSISTAQGTFSRTDHGRKAKKKFSKLKRFKVTATFSDHRGMKLAIWKSRKFTNV